MGDPDYPCVSPITGPPGWQGSLGPSRTVATSTWTLPGHSRNSSVWLQGRTQFEDEKKKAKSETEAQPQRRRAEAVGVRSWHSRCRGFQKTQTPVHRIPSGGCWDGRPMLSRLGLCGGCVFSRVRAHPRPRSRRQHTTFWGLSPSTPPAAGGPPHRGAPGPVTVLRPQQVAGGLSRQGVQRRAAPALALLLLGACARGFPMCPGAWAAGLGGPAPTGGALQGLARGPPLASLLPGSCW